ncbi:MAG: PilZ domain-containing protein [Gammaproteobacteria bacterium]|nr:PilZ domain-containing protein [Gammaproteobacteria bacterium]
MTVRISKHRSLTFHTRVAERLNDGDQPSYSLVLPSQLDGHQRRDAFRLATQGSARWQMGSIEIDQARVSDISISGVQISLPETPGDSPPLAVGEAIENCNLQIASLNLHCDLRVARIAEADSGITTIGAQMVTLDSSERRQLEQFIMREQRLQRLRSAV